MKNKIVLSVLVFFFSAVFLPALNFDGGGTLYDSTAVEVTETGESAGIDQTLALTGWFELDETKASGKSFSFAGQGRYELTEDRYYLFDIDYLRYFMRLPGAVGASSVFELSAGRFFFSEPTGMIMAHTADGISVNLLYPKVHFTVSGGYTGFLLNPKSDIRVSDADWSDEGNEEAFYLGPKRIVTMAELTFPGISRSKNQRFSIIAAAQFDLRKDLADGRYHTQYLGIKASPLFGHHMYMDFPLYFRPERFIRQLKITGLSWAHCWIFH